MSDVAIRVEGLGKKYRIGSSLPRYGRLTETLWSGIRAPLRRIRSSTNRSDTQYIWALHDVSLEVKQGDVVGLIGRNGAGKTTLLKVLSRITEPTEGYAEIQGRVGSLLEVGTGFHPELSGRENIYLSGALLGMRRSEINRKFDAIVAFAEVERFIDTSVKRYSTGMQVRLAFAVAAHLDTEILLVDEILAVGDAAFQRKSLGTMEDVAHRGRTVLFVSHNMASIRHLCNQAILLEHGRETIVGETDEVISEHLSSLRSINSGDGSLSNASRTGTGDARFKRIAFFSSAGHPLVQAVTGESLVIALDYETRCEVDGIATFGLNVLDEVGGRLFGCVSTYLGHRFRLDDSGGTALCKLQRLGLLPGHYTLEAWVKVDGIIADWVSPIGILEVAPGDFLGTGRLPTRQTGPFVVEYDWEVE